MANWRLADLFVELSVQGAEALNQKLNGVKTELDKVQAGVEAVGRVADRSIGRAVAAFTGLTAAGVATSNMGAALASRFEVLSRSVASVLLPALEQVLGVLDEAIGFFQSLSGEEQENIAHWVEGAVVGLAFVKVLPLVIGGIEGVATAIGVLSTVVEAFSSSVSGGLLALLQALLVPLAKIATVALGVGVGVGVATGAFSGLAEKLGPVFEAFQQLVGTLMDAFQPVLESIVGAIGMVGDVVLSVMPAVTEIVGNLGQALAEVFGFLMDILKAVISMFGALVQAVMPIVRVLSRVLQVVMKWGTTLMRFFAVPMQLVMSLVEAAAPLVESLASVFESALMPVLEAVGKYLDWLTGLLGKVVSGFRSFLGLADRSKPFAAAVKKTVTEEGHRELGTGRGGFEATTETLNRLQSAAAKADHARNTADNTKKTADGVQGIFGLLKSALGGSGTLKYAQ
jgi:phage-related protein